MTAPASKVRKAKKLKARTLNSDPHATPIPRARIISLVTVALAIMLAATVFACATWDHFWKPSEKPPWLIIPPLLTVMFAVTTILARRHSNFWLRLAYRICAIWIGVLSLTFFAAIAAWILSAALVLFALHIEPRIIAVIFFGGAILMSLCALANAAWLRVTRVTAKLPNLPKSWHGCELALVTDLHLGNVRGAGWTRNVVNKLQQLQPGAIFISGDMYDGSKADLDALIAPWKNISPPAGIYFVTGNHEEFTDRAQFLDAVKRAGIRILNNEKAEVNGIQIVGAHDGEASDPTVFRALLRRAKLDRNRPIILLAHRPSNLAIAETEGVSLQVSGHTHGGQLWPWTWVASRVHGRFNHGLNRLDKMLVHTSYGVGTWGAPMRLGTKPEIVLIRLESAES